MSSLKRFGILCLDVLLFLCGIALTLALAGHFFWYQQGLFVPLLFAGTCVSMLLLFLRRRSAQKSGIVMDAERFLAARRAAPSNPRRARYFRALRRCALWIPSALAAFVLFCYPQASHIAWLGADRLIFNQAHIPWSCTVFYVGDTPAYGRHVVTICGKKTPWPFGRHGIWNRATNLSIIVFRSMSAQAARERVESMSRKERYAPPEPEPEMRVLESRGITLTCREIPQNRFRISSSIRCDTTSPLKDRNLAIDCYGAPEDISFFYQVIRDFGPAR